MILNLLLSIDVGTVSINGAIGIATFISSIAVMRYKLKAFEQENKKLAIELEKTKQRHSSDIEKANQKQEADYRKGEALRLADKDSFFKIREKDQKSTDERFDHVDFKREQLKDTFIEKMHNMDKKLTEIHTIIVTNKK